MLFLNEKSIIFLYSYYLASELYLWTLCTYCASIFITLRLFKKTQKRNIIYAHYFHDVALYCSCTFQCFLRYSKAHSIFSRYMCWWRHNILFVYLQNSWWYQWNRLSFNSAFVIFSIYWNLWRDLLTVY